MHHFLIKKEKFAHLPERIVHFFMKNNPFVGTQLVNSEKNRTFAAAFANAESDAIDLKN